MTGERLRAGEPLERADRRAVRRTALLEAAVEAIRAQGPGVTMEQLAKAGGVTKPILYRHFGDRDGLITAIADRYATDLMSEIVAPLMAEATGRELLRSTIDAYVRFIERDPNLYRFLVQHPPERGERLTSISALVDNIARQVAQILGQRLADAGRDTGPAVAWAYGIVGLVHQAGDWWVDDQTMHRERLVDYLILLLWDGIGGSAGADAGGPGA
jgi:AcrR family transcriptional regulator